VPAALFASKEKSAIVMCLNILTDMKMKSCHLLPLFLGAAIALVSCSNDVPKAYGEPVFGTVKEDAPVAETTCGKVRGENRDGIAIFRGIPYGAPVSGEGRFLPAKPAQAWEGVRECTSVDSKADFRQSGFEKGASGRLFQR